MQCFAESQKKTAGDATAQSVAKSSAPRTGGLSFIDKKVMHKAYACKA